MEEDVVRMLFTSDTLTRYEYGDEFIEVDPSTGSVGRKPRPPGWLR